MEELPDEQLIHVLRSATTMTGISTYLKALLTESADRLERHRDDAMNQRCEHLIRNCKCEIRNKEKKGG